MKIKIRYDNKLTEVEIPDDDYTLMLDIDYEMRLAEAPEDKKEEIERSAIAKDYGKSAIWMNRYLHEKGIQFKQGDIWLLYQKYAEKGYTSTKTHSYLGSKGETRTKVHTYWTQKGRLFIYDLLKANGILPQIEMEEV